MTTIYIADVFSRTPGGRYREHGPFSGEAFRDDVLVPLVSDCADEVTVCLDGVAGMPGGFLEEVFGGLVRKCGPHAADKVRVITSERRFADYTLLARRFMDEAVRAQSAGE